MGKFLEIINELNLELKELKKMHNFSSVKVSIIVPAYNCEEYIVDCLFSLIKQTMEEIEIIVVNDGSTDDTFSIISTFAQNDSRIKVINQENQGPSFARNFALKIAQGEYVSFVDSDDWIDEDFIEKLYFSAKNNNADISIASIIRKRKIFGKYRVSYMEEKIYESLEEKIRICDIPRCCYACGKLYKKELIEGIEFSIGRYFEDVLWLPEIIKKANKIVTVPNATYYYRVNNNSIVKKIPSNKKQEDSYVAKKYIKKFFEKNDLRLTEKQKIITKRIKYLGKIPILKIKEYENWEIFYLFSFIKIFKKRV